MFAAGFIIVATACDVSGATDKAAAPLQKADTAPKSFVTTHTARIGGAQLRYRAIAEELIVGDSNGEPAASIFSTTYLREGTGDATDRPVTFVFNGGPGSASIWLHMGLFGPKRVVVPSEAEDDGAGPIRIVENSWSPLDVTDVVMIDPVGTGFSKAVNGHEDKEFWGIGQDAAVLSNFIRVWLTKYKRWDSPKYLAGESYGTTRAAAMTRALAQEEFGSTALNGVILISTVLDFQGVRPMAHNAQLSITYLPSYAATAWRHGKIADAEDLEMLLNDAREFALTDYAVALAKAQRLAPDARAAVRKKLSYFTGLSEAYLDSVDLNIHPFRFMKELLRDQGLTVGRLDSRYAGRDFDSGGERYDSDPSNYGIGAAYSAAAMQYFAEDLGVDMGGLLYKTVNRSGVKPDWDWTMPDNGRWSMGMNPEWPSHVNVAAYLGDEMRQNADFRVLLASGYFDLATPFFGAENSMYQTGMIPERVTFKYYMAGHMMYVHQPSLEALSRDIRDFIKAGAD